MAWFRMKDWQLRLTGALAIQRLPNGLPVAAGRAHVTFVPRDDFVTQLAGDRTDVGAVHVMTDWARRRVCRRAYRRAYLRRALTLSGGVSRPATDIAGVPANTVIVAFIAPARRVSRPTAIDGTGARARALRHADFAKLLALSPRFPASFLQAVGAGWLAYPRAVIFVRQAVRAAPRLPFIARITVNLAALVIVRRPTALLDVIRASCAPVLAL